MRTNHVHIIVDAEAPPEKIMNDFKAYASRALNRIEGDEQAGGDGHVTEARFRMVSSKTKEKEISMKHIVTMTLMFNLGVAGIYAQQRPVRMTFSGSMVGTTINFAPNTITDEEQLAGNGSLGPFTFRKLRVDAVSPQPATSCSGPTQVNIPVVAGGGVFRFQDGSLLTVTVPQGALCIDFAAMVAHLNETYQITGGTGRFKGASGTLTLTG